MIYYVLKILITTLLIILVAELSKRSSFLGAFLASVPLISLLAILWLYVDTGDIAKVSALSSSIFWLVLPSLVLFVTLPILLRSGLAFYASIAISVSITVLCYWAMVSLLGHYGIKL